MSFENFLFLLVRLKMSGKSLAPFLEKHPEHAKSILWLETQISYNDFFGQ